MDRLPTDPDTRGMGFRADAAWLVLVAGVAVPLLSFLVPSTVQLHFLLFFSGAGLATLLYRSGNVAEWVGLSIASSLILFSFWTGLLWHFRLSAPGALWGAILGTNLLLALILRSRPKRITFRVGRFDVLVLVLWAVIRALQVAVFIKNGHTVDGAGEPSFVARGWFARDTLYFYALVEQAACGRSWPMWNPFFGGVPIVYPRLLHVGLAGLLTLSGERISAAASGLMALGLIPIVTLGLGLVKSAARRARRQVRWPIAGVVLLYALALRLDVVLYPQTQFFVLGSFLLFARVMMIVGLRPLKGDAWWMTAGWMLALFLILAHQVSGTAALFSWVLISAVMGASRGWRVWKWGAWAGSAAALVLVVLFPGGDPHLRSPGGEIDWRVVQVWTANLRGWLPAFAFTVWAGFFLRRLRPQIWSAAGLVILTLWVVVWGGMQDYVHSRIILVFNAERYLYHGFLLAFPAAALLFSHYWRLCRGRRSLRAALLLLLMLPFLQMPPLSYKSRGLVTDDPVVIPSDQLKVYGWIRANTSADAVFLQGPVRGPSDLERFERTLPALTGRSLYVADIYNIWGYAGIPAYEHTNRLRFVRDAYAGRYGPGALAESCVARGIDGVLVARANEPSPVGPLFPDPWFEPVYRMGNASLLRPVPPTR